MALKGDTIRLEVQFKDFDGVLVEPTNVTLTIYNEDNMAVTSMMLTNEDQIGVGSYFYDFTIPYGVGDFIIYEFSGIYRTKTILTRDTIHLDFV